MDQGAFGKPQPHIPVTLGVMYPPGSFSINLVPKSLHHFRPICYLRAECRNPLFNLLQEQGACLLNETLFTEPAVLRERDKLNEEEFP